jgi:hypothetical protein
MGLDGSRRLRLGEDQRLSTEDLDQLGTVMLVLDQQLDLSV